jgi:hypothetical protein
VALQIVFQTAFHGVSSGLRISALCPAQLADAMFAFSHLFVARLNLGGFAGTQARRPVAISLPFLGPVQNRF